MKEQKSNGSDHSHGDLVVKKAMEGVTGGLNLAVGENAINNALLALEQQTKVLVKAKYDPSKPELVARSAAHTAKVVDEITRLVAFAKGGPDSRIETQASAAEEKAMDGILQSLTKDQFDTLLRWRKEADQNEPGENKQ